VAGVPKVPPHKLKKNATSLKVKVSNPDEVIAFFSIYLILAGAGIA
jgi:hypothetical protein